MYRSVLSLISSCWKVTAACITSHALLMFKLSIRYWLHNWKQQNQKNNWQRRYKNNSQYKQRSTVCSETAGLNLSRVGRHLCDIRAIDAQYGASICHNIWLWVNISISDLIKLVCPTAKNYLLGVKFAKTVNSCFSNLVETELISTADNVSCNIKWF